MLLSCKLLALYLQQALEKEFGITQNAKILKQSIEPVEESFFSADNCDQNIWQKRKNQLKLEKTKKFDNYVCLWPILPKIDFYRTGWILGCAPI